MSFHLAQVNIARLAEPIDSARLRPFVDQLAPVNALAERSPGFVWRLQTEDGDATALQIFGDAELIVNLTVWESLDALRAFAYHAPAHVAVLRRRRDWFVRSDEPMAALWWVPVGTLPTVGDAEQRLALLRSAGPSQDAFTFRVSYPAPHGLGIAVVDERELCPAP